MESLAERIRGPMVPLSPLMVPSAHVFMSGRAEGMKCIWSANGLICGKKSVPTIFLSLLLLNFKVVKTHNCEDLVLKDLHQDNTPKQL